MEGYSMGPPLLSLTSISLVSWWMYPDGTTSGFRTSSPHLSLFRSLPTVSICNAGALDTVYLNLDFFQFHLTSQERIEIVTPTQRARAAKERRRPEPPSPGPGLALLSLSLTTFISLARLRLLRSSLLLLRFGLHLSLPLLSTSSSPIRSFRVAFSFLSLGSLRPPHLSPVGYSLVRPQSKPPDCKGPISTPTGGRGKTAKKTTSSFNLQRD
ncbi:hypothetical protein ASPTUDRAFT_733451 [Aspergillus tubingensis CBS 134.48]|uniref:Uncharacterized protein n=1 Tax=Aspergillus tubingensis (strain CBS 134.48) TaxID=767770 RepID=A0A1L9MXN3_ASPTC|nr:hypothetical protein ASPTUDRAFT_733451 [Aspergillus tubingensis CBS 134.48]